MNMAALRPQTVLAARTNLLVALGVFVVSLITYMLTQSLSLPFWDAGEYITCSSILGVPHPPGNPFYILLGRFFCILVPGIAHATLINALSGLMSALAVMFLYLFTVKLVSMYEEKPWLVLLSGLLAAFYCAWSFTFWCNAVEAEVYSGLALTLNLSMYLTMLWVERSRDFSHQNLLLLIVYILFLGFCIHQTSLQLGPAILFIVVYPLLLQHGRSYNFWTRAAIYAVIMAVLYATIDPIGKGAHVPDLSKYLVFAAVAGLLVWHMRKYIPGKAWLLALVFMALALTPHIFLMVRSGQRPFINEGMPHNLKMFTDYILRRQYGVTSFFERRYQVQPYGAHTPFIISYIGQIKQFLQYFGWQFFHAQTIAGWLGSPLQIIRFLGNLIVIGSGVGGFLYQLKRNKHSWAYLAMLFFWSSFAMVAVMNLSDTEVRERDYFYTNAYYLWGVWMAIGGVALVRWAMQRKKLLGVLASALVLLVCGLNAASMWFIHDHTRNVVALDYGQNFLNSLEENAIIFTNGDNDTFPLWYAQAVADPLVTEHVWPSRGVVSSERTKSILQDAMAYKATQCRGIRQDVSVACLSLLNTGWYIRQMRDKEGIEFNLNDEYITPDIYGTALARQRLPRDIRLDVNSPAGHLVTDVIPKGTVLGTSDLAVLRIIKDNWGKRPIYFAVTIPDDVLDNMGLSPYLRNEGMVDRLVVDKDDYVDIDRLLANIEGVYQYRGIGDPNIYKDDNATRLLGNYGHAFIIIASQYYMKNGEYDKAIHYMEEGIRFVPNNPRMKPGLAQLYMRAGRVDEAHAMVQEIAKTNSEDLPALYIELSRSYTDAGKPDMAYSVMEEAVNLLPNEPTLVMEKGYTLLDNNRPDEAFACFDKVIALLPNERKLPQILYGSAIEANRPDLGAHSLKKLLELRKAMPGIDNTELEQYIQQLELLTKTPGA